MKNTVLKVRLWGKEVGSLRWDERKGVAYFAYSEEFLTSGLNPFPFVAPLGVAKSYLPIVGDKKKIFAGLSPFVADSLPDNWGSLVFEQWAQNQGLRSRDITPLDKLAYIGKRGIGALEYFPKVIRDWKLTILLLMNWHVWLAKSMNNVARRISFLKNH